MRLSAQHRAVKTGTEVLAAPRLVAAPRRAGSQRRQAPAPVTPAGSGRANSSVVCLASAASAPSSSQAAESKASWYALVANQQFFFNDVQNESLAEQLRERVRFYKEQGMEQDFFFVPDPVWLEQQLGDKAKQVKRPCVALVSTDKSWITFMKLRLDRVLKVELVGLDKAAALKAGGTIPDSFPNPAKWTAPYGAYAAGWWKVFLPPK